MPLFFKKIISGQRNRKETDKRHKSKNEKKNCFKTLKQTRVEKNEEEQGRERNSLT